MPIIIDGYNLMFAPRKRTTTKLSAKQAEAQRKRLISRLNAYRAAASEEVTVVFDGGKGDWSMRRVEKEGEIEVIYSSGFESADDEITRLVRAYPDPRRVLVVSSDVELRRAVGKLGAKVVRSTDFNRQMGEAFRLERESQPQEPPEKFEGLSPGEAEGWLKELGFAPEEEQ